MKKMLTVVIFLAAFVFSACGKDEQPVQKPIVRPVKVITVAGKMGTNTISLPGQIRANKRVGLSFKVFGPLVELPVARGPGDKKGSAHRPHFTTGFQNQSATGQGSCH